jgi:hypothetical protein
MAQIRLGTQSRKEEADEVTSKQKYKAYIGLKVQGPSKTGGYGSTIAVGAAKSVLQRR